jgi:hypothetical protein
MCDKVSSTNETDSHDITEIFVESGVKHHNPNPLKMHEENQICAGV